MVERSKSKHWKVYYPIFFFHFSELGLTDELLAFLYWPVSMENELQLNIPTMLENHEKYAEKLKAFNLSRDARAQLAIK